MRDLYWLPCAVVLLTAARLAGGPSIDLQAGEAPISRPIEAASGSVEGQVFYRNDAQRRWRYARYYVKSPRTGELAEAVVALSGAGRANRAAGRPQVTVVDQKDMRFVPETVAIRAGDRVRFTNSDPQTHNIALNDPRRQFNDTIASGQEAVELFPRPSGIRLPFALGCSIHSQMQGWVYVFDHPFFQVTGPDGRYRLDLAHSAGDLHASRQIEVKANETLRLEIVLTPEDRSIGQP